MKRLSWFRRLEQVMMRGSMWLVAHWYLRKPDQTELLQIKFSTFYAVWCGVINELFFLVGSPRSGRLFSLNLEVTNTCNLQCEMCPVNHGMQREKGFMDFDLFTRIIDTTPGLEFALVFQWGEPLLHPRFFDMIDYAVSRGVRTMITTNGTIMTDEEITRLVSSGLERLTFSVDGVGQTHTDIRGFDYETLKANIIRLRSARDKAGSSLKIDTSMVVWDKTEADVDEYRRQWSLIADRVQLIPRFTQQPRRHKCRELWRGTLVVLWDGRVAACCADYEGKLIVGDVLSEPLLSIWNGPKMRRLRLMHSQGRFSGTICADCAEYKSAKASTRFS